MLGFHTPHSPATEEQVSSVETRAGVALPADYREFLLAQNGGYRPDPGIFDVPGEGAGEAQEYADNPDNWAIDDVNTICNYDPSIIPHLNAVHGSAFARAAEADHFEEEPLHR